jgi:DNA invertase Pin-like site-specific DNA recombinase
MPYKSLAAYARLSRKADGTVESIEFQNGQMQDLADQCGHVVTAWFDDTITGFEDDKYRPGWEGYLKALASGDHDGALSYHVDRITRNWMQGARLDKVCRDRGLPLLSPEQILDVGRNDDHSFMFGILVLAARHQSASTRRRERDKKDAARRMGIMRYAYGGPAPLGFRSGDGRDWQIDDEAAAWLRAAARRVLAGESVEAVHESMPQIRTAAGAVVSRAALRRALLRPASGGVITGRDGEILRRAEAPGPLPYATWQRLRTLFRGRSRAGRPPVKDSNGEVQFPFGVVLRCWKCGNQLSGENKRQWYRRRDGTLVISEARPYYRCQNPHTHIGVTRPCRKIAIPADGVHALLRETVEAWQASPRYQEAVRAADVSERQAELDAELRFQQQAQADLWDNMRRKHISEIQYKQGSAEVGQKIDAVLAEIAAVGDVAARRAPAGRRGVPWAKMTAAEKVDKVRECVETPITVGPGKSGPKPLTAADRLRIIPLR